MPKLPVISGAACVKALLKWGFVIEVQQGSHIILTHPAPKKRLSVPNHRELDRGTLRAIIRQAGLTVVEFTKLL